MIQEAVTWEAATHLENAWDVVYEFHQANPGRPMPLIETTSEALFVAIYPPS